MGFYRERLLPRFQDKTARRRAPLGYGGGLDSHQGVPSFTRMVVARVLRTAQDLVAARLLRPEALEARGGEATTLLDRVMRRELAPHACARALLTRMGGRTPDA